MYSVQLQGLGMCKIDRGPSHLFDFIALSEVNYADIMANKIDTMDASSLYYYKL